MPPNESTVTVRSMQSSGWTVAIVKRQFLAVEVINDFLLIEVLPPVSLRFYPLPVMLQNEFLTSFFA